MGRPGPSPIGLFSTYTSIKKVTMTNFVRVTTSRQVTSSHLSHLPKATEATNRRRITRRSRATTRARPPTAPAPRDFRGTHPPYTTMCTGPPRADRDHVPPAVVTCSNETELALGAEARTGGRLTAARQHGSILLEIY